MKLLVNGRWEAERIAQVIETWQPANGNLVPWRDNLVRRIRLQVDADKIRHERFNPKPPVVARLQESVPSVKSVVNP